MNKIVIKPFNVIDQTDLPELSVDQIPVIGEPLEIKEELYYVCEDDNKQHAANPVIGVIPLVVRDPSKVSNIHEYLHCLSIAHRKVQFKNKKGTCDFDNCDEIIIT
jgi:hypothetical protein